MNRPIGPMYGVVPAMLLLTVTCLHVQPQEAVPRPEQWAQPLVLAGAPNLHKVSPVLYRSAQPSRAGMQALKQDLGIQTVVNLRSFHSDRDEMRGTGMAYEHITMKAWHAEEKELVRFLKIVTSPAAWPILVHCQHGADRTGLMCAVYRVVVCDWSREEALREMTEGGYGYHTVWVNLPRDVLHLDVAHLRRLAGIPAAGIPMPEGEAAPGSGVTPGGPLPPPSSEARATDSGVPRQP